MEKEYVKLRGFLILNRRQYLERSRDSKKPEATKTEKEKKLQEVEGISSALKEWSRETRRSKWTRKLAKKLGISDFSARKILREDLGKKPFKFLKRQKLTDAAKLKRLQRARALYQQFSGGKHRQIFFSDENCSTSSRLVFAFKLLTPF